LHLIPQDIFRTLLAAFHQCIFHVSLGLLSEICYISVNSRLAYLQFSCYL
jgi:hypothetical protein